MEWAYELGHSATAAATRACGGWCQTTRTIVIPVVNPDGFNASREAGELYLRGDGAADRRRRRRRRSPTRSSCSPPRPIRTSTGARTAALADRRDGRQLRPGRHRASRRRASTRTATTAASGAARARTHQPADADLPRPGAVLRARDAERPRARLGPPGDHADHQPHVLGPRAAPARASRRRAHAPTSRSTRRSATRMAAENGYASQNGYELYDTTGTTEDWTLLRPRAGSASRSRSATWASTRRSRRPWPSGTGRPTTRTGGGNRAAYYQAQENTADATQATRCSPGRRPPGRCCG